jgi:P27 family predicted phage terminase small subunit
MEEPNIIQPPSTLTPYALEEWQRLAPMARRLRTLKASTARSFELLVETLATERKARELVERHGITIRTGHGGSAKPYPAVRTMETARVQAAALLKLFRLDPDQPPTAAPNPEKPRNSAWKGVLE